MMAYFMVLSAIWNLSWGVMWRKSDVLNTAIKISFYGMGLISMLYAAELFGYVVKLGG